MRALVIGMLAVGAVGLAAGVGMMVGALIAWRRSAHRQAHAATKLESLHDFGRQIDIDLGREAQLADLVAASRGIRR